MDFNSIDIVDYCTGGECLEGKRMSNLNDLVPPLELCKLIPDGEFADSAFLYEAMVGMAFRKILDIRIIPRQRITSNPYIDCDLGREYHLYPAPTLQEIMADMQYCRVYKKTSNFFVAVKEKDRVASFNAATSAMKLWLKLKGIEA